MEELNRIREKAKNRMLICFFCVLAVGVAACFALGHFVFLFFFLVFAAIFAVLAADKPRKEYRRAFKEAVVRQALESVFSDLCYEPDMGIAYDVIAGTGMMNMGDRFRSEDFISGGYRDICFSQSDVHIQEEHRSTDSDGHTSSSYVTIFRGRWMIFDFNKEFRARLQITQRGFPNAKRKRFFGRKETLFKRVEMESESFNRGFLVYAQDEHEAFYVITPSFMERVERLAANNRGKLMLCFVDQQLHIAIHDNVDSFEPGSLFSRVNEERILDRIQSEIDTITQFVDELKLDNNLFI